MLDSESVARAHAFLQEDGTVEALSHEESDVQEWLDDELASLVESRLGERGDARPIDGEVRRDWLARATEEGRLYSPHTGYSIPYWITSDGERIGTAAVASSSLGNAFLAVSSLYVRQTHRSRGHGRRVLEALRRAATCAGLTGIRLDASWCWTPSIRFYVGAGMWVRGWKRDLVFASYRDLPRWSVEREGDEARFLLEDGTKKQERVAIVARRDGDRLLWTETELMNHRDRENGEVPYLAPGTFAVWLALNGFPLVTSDAAWQEQLTDGWSDMGGPEGLAFKIRIWEAWQRHRGWLVHAQPVPGLSYPTWEEIRSE